MFAQWQKIDALFSKQGPMWDRRNRFMIVAVLLFSLFISLIAKNTYSTSKATINHLCISILWLTYVFSILRLTDTFSILRRTDTFRKWQNYCNQHTVVYCCRSRLPNCWSNSGSSLLYIFIGELCCLQIKLSLFLLFREIECSKFECIFWHLNEGHKGHSIAQKKG